MAKREMIPTHTYKGKPVQFIHRSFISSGKQNCTILMTNRFGKLQLQTVQEKNLIPIDFHCPCGCNGNAEECVYAAKCPQCGKKFYGGSGYADRASLCDECKVKPNLCQHCTSEFTCPNAAEARSQCTSFGHG